MNNNLQNKKIYFEAGAHDGSFQSRSYMFKDDSTYFGILVEPSPDIYTACVQNRGNSNTLIYNCALVSNEYTSNTVKLYPCSYHSAMNITEMSLLDYEAYSSAPVEVPARTVQSILDENGITYIDSMFLDVEGAEKNVLLGIDFSKTKINFLEVETHIWTNKTISVEEEVQMFKDILQKYMILKNIDYSEGHPKAIFKCI